jgi:small subunit ribosomal protein S3
MGQKTNPNGFRLITTKSHLSKWYTSNSNYSNFLKEDFYIRSEVEKYFSPYFSISKTEIQRISQEEKNHEYTKLTIQCLFPKQKEMSKKLGNYFTGLSKDSLPISQSNLKRFTTFLVKTTIRQLVRKLQIKLKKNYYVVIQFIKNPFEDSMLIAKYVAEQLERRVPFRRAMKQVIDKVKRTEIKGIKVAVAGRLNGIEIARTEWKREGQIPLHTLKANIDYTNYSAQTIYGLIGIKIWLLK